MPHYFDHYSLVLQFEIRAFIFISLRFFSQSFILFIHLEHISLFPHFKKFSVCVTMNQAKLLLLVLKAQPYGGLSLMQTHELVASGSLTETREAMDQESLSSVPGPQWQNGWSWYGPGTWGVLEQSWQTYKTAQTFFFFFCPFYQGRGQAKKNSTLPCLQLWSESQQFPAHLADIFRLNKQISSHIVQMPFKLLLFLLYLWQVSLCASRSVIFLPTAGPEMVSVSPIHLSGSAIIRRAEAVQSILSSPSGEIVYLKDRFPMFPEGSEFRLFLYYHLGPSLRKKILCFRRECIIYVQQ